MGMGSKNAFLDVFRLAYYRRYQEDKLNARKQAGDEDRLAFYFGVLDLCKKVDPDMPEVKKVDDLLRVIKRSLAKEHIIPYEEETCDEFNDERNFFNRYLQRTRTWKNGRSSNQKRKGSR